MDVYRCEKITKDSISQNVSEKVKLKVPQLCPILRKPMDYPVHGIFQVRILEWVAFPFSKESPQPDSSKFVIQVVGIQVVKLLLRKRKKVRQKISKFRPW